MLVFLLIFFIFLFLIAVVGRSSVSAMLVQLGGKENLNRAYRSCSSFLVCVVFYDMCDHKVTHLELEVLQTLVSMQSQYYSFYLVSSRFTPSHLFFRPVSSRFISLFLSFFLLNRFTLDLG